MNETFVRRRFSVTLFLLYWVFAFGLTALHELGHALLPLSKSLSVRSDLGAPYGAEFKIGKLTWALGSLTNPWYGFTHLPRLLASDELVALVSGPFVSLVCASVGFLVFQKIKNSENRKARSLSLFVFWYAFLQALFMLAPVVYPDWLGPYGGRPSDGLRMMEILELRK